MQVWGVCVRRTSLERRELEVVKSDDELAGRFAQHWNDAHADHLCGCQRHARQPLGACGSALSAWPAQLGDHTLSLRACTACRTLSPPSLSFCSEIDNPARTRTIWNARSLISFVVYGSARNEPSARSRGGRVPGVRQPARAARQGAWLEGRVHTESFGHANDGAADEHAARGTSEACTHVC